ncbi:MAG: ATP-binding protein [Gammaproteobacteria bacterium]
MSETDKLVQRLHSFLDRLEPLLPPQANPAEKYDGGAFRWRRTGNSGVIQKIDYPPHIRLNDLQCITRQKEAITTNTRQFLANMPANNVLLWGPRGTGKSSLIKALLNEFADQGLNMIEVQRQDLDQLRDITEQLRQHDARFILFCDDLSFEANDPSYKAIKVVLDGSLSATPDNVLIYASSNRRHLLPESMRDNVDSHMVADELHLNEAIEEKISLSERFGVWLAFHPFNQEQYLAIVDYWIKQLQTQVEDAQQLRKEALKWALEHGSRSGRAAYQFARDWSGKQQLGKLDNEH